MQRVSAGSDWFREWVASPTGRWLTPVASTLLILLGLFFIFSSVGGGEKPLPIASPAPTATQDLDTAMAAARKYLIKQSPNSYGGFTVVAAEGAAPSLEWTKSETPVEGKITIRTGGKTGIVLVTKSGATVYCIADVNADEEVSRGKVDAKKPAECTGGW